MEWTNFTLQVNDAQLQVQGDESALHFLDGVPYVTYPGLSACAGIRHLFTTRFGGVSDGIYESLNFSYKTGDDKNKVDANYACIAKTMGVEVDRIVCSDQTHTNHVRRVTAADGGMGIVRPRDYRDVDGLITNEPELVLATFFADCVPLFFVDPVERAIGLAHSGWRGTVSEIGAVMVREMEKNFGTKPENLRTAIGPSICQSCYEVSEDVALAFQEVYPEKVHGMLMYEKKTPEGLKYQLNLQEACRQTLLSAGVPYEQIEMPPFCTCCNPKLFFSHRASHGKRGTLGAFLKIEKACTI